jgi:thioredoxin-dependent peroxiredoxin
MMPRIPKPQFKRRVLRVENLESRRLYAADWQNTLNPLDVNQSGAIEASDALSVINDLITFGARDLGVKNADYDGPLRDTSGDGRLTVLDALLVINSLIRIDAGDVAPQVLLPNQSGELVDLKSFVGEHAVVLYFYPKDDTPGCTVEALDFSARNAEIESLGAKVFGVSLDNVGSHENFADKHTLNFDILADVDRTATIAYGALTQTSTGEPIARRTTFIIGKDGIIKKVYTNVQVSVHGAAVVADLRDGIAD